MISVRGRDGDTGRRQEEGFDLVGPDLRAGTGESAGESPGIWYGAGVRGPGDRGGAREGILATGRGGRRAGKVRERRGVGFTWVGSQGSLRLPDRIFRLLTLGPWVIRFLLDKLRTFVLYDKLAESQIFICRSGTPPPTSLQFVALPCHLGVRP